MRTLFSGHPVTPAYTKQQEENKFGVNAWLAKNLTLKIGLGGRNQYQSNLYFLLYFSFVQYNEIPAILSTDLYASTVADKSRAKLARPF